MKGSSLCERCSPFDMCYIACDRNYRDTFVHVFGESMFYSYPLLLVFNIAQGNSSRNVHSPNVFTDRGSLSLHQNNSQTGTM